MRVPHRLPGDAGLRGICSESRFTDKIPRIVHNRVYAEWSTPRTRQFATVRRREVKPRMKHVQTVSARKPLKAEEWLWISWKQIFGPIPLTDAQAGYVYSIIDNVLRK